MSIKQMSLQAINGLGPKYVQLLEKSNIKTFEKLVNSDNKKLAKIFAKSSRVSEKDFNDWKKQAKQLMPKTAAKFKSQKKVKLGNTNYTSTSQVNSQINALTLSVEGLKKDLSEISKKLVNLTSNSGSQQQVDSVNVTKATIESVEVKQMTTPGNGHPTNPPSTSSNAVQDLYSSVRASLHDGVGLGGATGEQFVIIDQYQPGDIPAPDNKTDSSGEVKSGDEK